MTIIATPQLQGTDLKEAENLIKICQAHDKTYRTPYLSNMLNFDQEMPAFFRAYHKKELVGLLTVYADTPDVEITINVHPDYRRKGYAKSLFQAFQNKTANYGLTSWTFMTEKVFLDKHPDLLKHWHLTVDEDSEIWLGRQRDTLTTTALDKTNIRLANMTDVDGIATLQAEAFEKDLEVSKHYAKEAIADPSSLLYVFEDKGKIISSCTVDLSTELNYLYGLAVLKEHRGQGIGSSLVSYILQLLPTINQYDFQIAVDIDNIAARRLYEKLGFTYQTEVIYLDPIS